MTTRMQKLIEWNADEARWRRYEKLRIALRLRAEYCLLSDDEIDRWAWLEAAGDESPRDCIGFDAERSR